MVAALHCAANNPNRIAAPRRILTLDRWRELTMKMVAFILFVLPVDPECMSGTTLRNRSFACLGADHVARRSSREWPVKASAK